VSIKKGAALSVVLAPGGTAMFWVTQGACAMAAGISDTADIIVPARTANNSRIVSSRSWQVSLARLRGNYDERPEDGQAWPLIVAVILRDSGVSSTP